MRPLSRFKKIACLAAALMLAACFAAYADSTIYTEDIYWYTIGADESITITGCFGRDEVLNLPISIAGKPVNHIAAGAFADCPARVINLPDTIMDVEEGAFPPDATVNWRVNASDQNGGSDEDKPGRPLRPGKDDELSDSENGGHGSGNGGSDDDYVYNPNGPASQGKVPAETESESAEGGAAMEVNIDDDALDKNTPDYMKKQTENGGAAATVADASDKKTEGNAKVAAEGTESAGSEGASEISAETAAETTADAPLADGPGMAKETKSYAGMIIGIIAGLALLAWIIWFFFIKRKKKDEEEGKDGTGVKKD